MFITIAFILIMPVQAGLINTIQTHINDLSDTNVIVSINDSIISEYNSTDFDLNMNVIEMPAETLYVNKNKTTIPRNIIVKYAKTIFDEIKFPTTAFGTIRPHKCYSVFGVFNDSRNVLSLVPSHGNVIVENCTFQREKDFFGLKKKETMELSKESEDIQDTDKVTVSKSASSPTPVVNKKKISMVSNKGTKGAQDNQNQEIQKESSINAIYLGIFLIIFIISLIGAYLIMRKSHGTTTVSTQQQYYDEEYDYDEEEYEDDTDDPDDLGNIFGGD